MGTATVRTPAQVALASAFRSLIPVAVAAGIALLENIQNHQITTLKAAVAFVGAALVKGIISWLTATSVQVVDGTK